MIFTPFTRRMFVTASVVAFFIPQASFAATSQQMLDASLKAYDKNPATKLVGTMSVDISQRALRKTYTPTKGTIRFSFSERTAATNSEGSVALDSLQFTGSPDVTTALGTLKSLDLKQPIRVDWKKVAASSYVNFKQLPTGILDFAKGLGADLSPFLNTWIRIDMSQFEAALKEQKGINAVTLLNAQSLSAFSQPLRVIRVDSRKTNAAGDKIVRLRVRINPALVTQEQNLELKTVNPKDPDRAALRSAINRRYAELRTTLNRFTIIAQVNQTTGALERIEAGGQQTEPKKDCTWNSKLERDVCTTTHTETTKFSLGISFLKDSGQPIQAPTSSIPYTVVIEQIQKEIIEASKSSMSSMQ